MHHNSQYHKTKSVNFLLCLIEATVAHAHTTWNLILMYQKLIRKKMQQEARSGWMFRVFFLLEKEYIGKSTSKKTGFIIVHPFPYNIAGSCLQPIRYRVAFQRCMILSADWMQLICSFSPAIRGKYSTPR